MTRLRIVASGFAIAWLFLPRIAAADPAPVCSGDYAEDISALSPRARLIERGAPSYSYAVRTSATYECVSYGADGELRRSRSVALAYGTAFGFRRDGDDTLLLTNDHVASWPEVTDDDHPVDGVAPGCKKVGDALRIVDDDHDDYPDDDIALARVVVDPVLDVAVLRAHAKLAIIPWQIGNSAALTTRTAVQVRGYPLGEFQATNVGKVISAHSRDLDGVRDHDDFIVDALLTSGGSGSPVFAVACKTGELELVGIFHAHYVEASALNLVIAIDQVRELLTTLQPTPPLIVRSLELDAAARAHLIEAMRADPDPPYFAVGRLVASARVRRDGALVFALFAGDFPRTSRPLIVLEDRPAATGGAFGSLGAAYVGGAGGLRADPLGDAPADIHAALLRTLTALRRSAVAAFDYRAAARTVADSRAAADRISAKRRLLDAALRADRGTAQAIDDVIDREAPRLAAAPAIGLGDIEVLPPAATALASGSL